VIFLRFSLNIGKIMSYRESVASRGVKKKPENQNRNRNRKTGKPGNRGPGSGSGLEKPKTGYPGSVPGFWHPVFTGLNINIYF
jgi:hypothetical protein